MGAGSEETDAFLLQGMLDFVRLLGRDLSLRQLTILLICVDALELQTIGGIAQHLGIARIPTSRAVDYLAGAGLIWRKTNPEDGRSILIGPTPTGRRLCALVVGRSHRPRSRG